MIVIWDKLEFYWDSLINEIEICVWVKEWLEKLKLV